MIPALPEVEQSVENEFFLIEPFDSLRDERKLAVNKALRSLYRPEDYKLVRADERIVDLSLFNDIYRKIARSRACIADLTGRPIEYPNTEDGTVRDVVYRPNVVLELGVALALQKPTVIIVRKLGGVVDVPTDLQFIRYVSLSEEEPWEDAEKKVAQTLRDTLPELALGILGDEGLPGVGDVIRSLAGFIRIQKGYKFWKGNTFYAVVFAKSGGHLVALLKSDVAAEPGLPLEYYKQAGNVQTLMGHGDVYLTQPNGMVQCRVLRDVDSGYLRNAFLMASQHGTYAPQPREVVVVAVPPPGIGELSMAELNNLETLLSKIGQLEGV